MEHKSANEFFELINDEDNTKPIVAKFGAEWCPPCQQFAPTIKSLAEDDSEFITLSVDIDEERELALHMGVESVPTTFLIYKGLCLDSIEGIMSKTQVRSWVKAGVGRLTVKSLEVPND